MLRKGLVRAGWALLITVLLTVAALATWEPFFAEQPGPPPPPRKYAADITRDEFGVPHIHGRTDPDVAFGVAYAHAEDDFSTLQDVVAMTRGRYDAIAGQDGAGVDFAYHFVGARATAHNHFGELPADVRAVLDAYASGLNRYAALHPGELKLARLFPVNGEDIAAGFALRQPFFFGLDRVLGPLAEGKPQLPEHGPSLTGTPPADIAQGGGDQMVARTGHAAPAADGFGGRKLGLQRLRDHPAAQRRWGHPADFEQPPALSRRGRVVRAGDRQRQRLAFCRGDFPGSPYPFLGHNENLGWTNTVNRPDLIDLYKLEVDGDASHYKLDGKWQVLEKHRVWLPVRFGPLVLPVPRNVWRAAQGPALVTPRGAFAVRYAGIDNIQSLEQYYRITKAQDFAQWQSAMALQGVPATNFIYADKAGNIANWYNAEIPDRKPGPDWRREVSGTDSSLIWTRAIPFASYPHLINPDSGFLFNSNNTPLVAAGPGSELDPALIPAIWGVETDMTNRARRAVKLLSEPGAITRDRLLAIKFDTGYERAGYVAFMLDGIAKLDLRGDPQLAKAQALLGTWDLMADGKGRADALAVMVLEEGMSASYGRRSMPDPRTELAKAAAHLIKYFGRLDPPLGEVIRIRQGAVDLPNDGGGDTLRAATSWNVDPDGRLSIKHGDSFVMLIEWGKDGTVHSESIQPYGAATTRKNDPHFADQASLFVAHKFKPVWFTRADVAAHAVRRETVSN